MGKASADCIRVVSPIDGSVYAERKTLQVPEASAAAERAAKAQRPWRDTPLDVRLQILTDAVARIAEEGDEIIEELARSMGRPVASGGGEVRGFKERANHMMGIASRALDDVTPEAEPGFDRFIRREPVGVVLTIAPWNYPYMTAVNSVWPALAAGNSVLLKHAQQTVVAGERLARVLNEAGLPENVFQALPMNHETTAAVMRSEPVRMICFTGALRGGRAVQRAVADASGFPGTGLELGGKDPAYVRPDADLQDAALGIADGVFSNAGQSCCSIERIYVHESVYEDFVERLVAEARKLRLGNPLDPGTTLGPVVKPEAAEFIRGQISDAVSAGARTLLDPAETPAEGGAYLAPQIVADVDRTMRLMTEESFGPVAGLMKVGSDDEALALINDSEYGLSASIWTQDVKIAETLGDRIETGTVFMNRCDYLDPALAWTGIKHTGRGCTMSVLGYEHLTRPKSFHLKTRVSSD